MVFLEVICDAPGLALSGVQVGADLADELGEVSGAAASEGVCFDVLVEAFGGVQFGGVAGQV